MNNIDLLLELEHPPQYDNLIYCVFILMHLDLFINL